MFDEIEEINDNDREREGLRQKADYAFPTLKQIRDKKKIKDAADELFKDKSLIAPLNIPKGKEQ